MKVEIYDKSYPYSYINKLLIYFEKKEDSMWCKMFNHNIIDIIVM